MANDVVIYQEMIDEIKEIIAKYGYPQDWNNDGTKGPERYIEAQVWTDDPIKRYKKIL